jgi:hypothetical protein
MSYTADQLGTIIKMACKKDIIDLGEDSEQDFYIFEWLNIFLLQNALKARVSVISDALVIASNGYVTFLRNSQPITDMVQPNFIYDTLNNDKQFTHRTSYDGAIGWHRRDAFSQIHVKGANSTYVLEYYKYPERITLGTQTPEYPPMGYGEMITWVVSQIKLTKNYLDESQMVLNQSNSVKMASVKASIAGKGSGQTPSESDANLG